MRRGKIETDFRNDPNRERKGKTHPKKRGKREKEKKGK